MNKNEKQYINEKLADYHDRIVRLTTESQEKKPDPYKDGFIRGLMLAYNDLGILYEGEV